MHLVPDPPRVVVIVAPDPSQELDVTGPTAVFSTANKLCGRDQPPYEVHVASVSDDAIVHTECGLRLLAEAPYHQIAGRIGRPVDTVLVAGGAGARIAADDAWLVGWLRDQAATVRRMGAVCTGAFPLCRTGLLDGQRVTTHWRHAERLAQRHPELTVDADPIWIRAGRFYTSAGVTAGMDLSLALVEEDLGHAVSLEVARELVMFLRRPGSQAQFSTMLRAQAAQSPELRALQTWIADNLGRDLSVGVLAEQAAMSPRNFARVFARQVGETPARYVERLRVEAVRRLLEGSDRRLEAIAHATGFGNADVMRQAFLRHVQTTPERYRAAFRADVAEPPGEDGLAA
ncbi:MULTISPECIES: helix-turn-helix domain-containing protein [unclassified Cupriavidus]|uniref:GlxA family transcriptional regulator n=1 Tax=unclassified Cupriavidus TaxID=2640874 RepID=UPI001C006741|nr:MULTISPECIES: helix-turn-helix domain-containing protein [unclassified Cupriavidus]MCA3193391.1 DJ-1/PfpI family protein [Cupriavidus sp.]MCA3198193.1 DJ-1/PfpI family protein [Cupriavidus sp.]MCA3204960.1 DJ-1/PfpI family protein [Cupriavidus sp.]MCA3208589.1 DJ-1/PfpI family protein [Cupriavidus sp.]QWE94347.1 DJ-1/PfpI family protein [Cupriavidus sp. EM10]